MRTTGRAVCFQDAEQSSSPTAPGAALAFVAVQLWRMFALEPSFFPVRPPALIGFLRIYGWRMDTRCVLRRLQCQELCRTATEPQKPPPPPPLEDPFSSDHEVPRRPPRPEVTLPPPPLPSLSCFLHAVESRRHLTFVPTPPLCSNEDCAALRLLRLRCPWSPSHCAPPDRRELFFSCHLSPFNPKRCRSCLPLSISSHRIHFVWFPSSLTSSGSSQSASTLLILFFRDDSIPPGRRLHVI